MDIGGASPRVENVGAGDGLVAFAAILAMNCIPADSGQFRHALGHQNPVSADELLRLAKGQDGVRAKAIKAAFDKLERLPLPAMGYGPHGWFVIGRVAAYTVLIQRPGYSPERVDREGLDRIWPGPLILAIAREGVAGSAGKFDSTWFIPQVVRFRKLIGEVLVHNTLVTPQVLSIGFLAISAWEMVFGWLRTRLYSERSQTHRAERQASISARGEAQVQAVKLAETLPLLDEQISANEQLLAKGCVSKLKVIEMRRQRLAAARDPRLRPSGTAGRRETRCISVHAMRCLGRQARKLGFGRNQG